MPNLKAFAAALQRARVLRIGGAGRLAVRAVRRSTGPGRSAGQSLVEFALVLPIVATLFVASIDLSRVYEQRVKLEAATRDAAEFASMSATSSSEALDQARRVVCPQFGQAATCSSAPSVTVTGYTKSTSSQGGTPDHPWVRVEVTSTTTFDTIAPYPFIAGGSVELTAVSSYAALQGR